jgi:predicted nucleic acid-binding protein
MQSLEMLSEIEGYEFWPDDLSYMEAQLKGITGHNQVTDAYLAALARRRNGKLATFDAALAATHSDAVLLSVS